MAEALDPATSAWEQVHGINDVSKVPPFTNEGSPQQSPEKIRDKLYDLEVDYEATNPFEEEPQPKKPATNPDRDYNLDNLPESASDSAL